MTLPTNGKVWGWGGALIPINKKVNVQINEDTSITQGTLWPYKEQNSSVYVTK